MSFSSYVSQSMSAAFHSTTKACAESISFVKKKIKYLNPLDKIFLYIFFFSKWNFCIVVLLAQRLCWVEVLIHNYDIVYAFVILLVFPILNHDV